MKELIIKYLIIFFLQPFTLLFLPNLPLKDEIPVIIIKLSPYPLFYQTTVFHVLSLP